MPTAKTPKTIKITVSSGVKGQPITIRNRTTGEKLSETLAGTASHLAELENFTTDYTAGDVIDVMVSGQRVGHNSLTLGAGNVPQSVTVSTVAVTTGNPRGI